MKWPWWKTVAPVSGKFKKMDSRRHRKILKRQCEKEIKEYKDGEQ